MTILEAILVAIVEGLTEFLPISSTGHMIITEKLLGVPDNEFTKLFTVGIQLGAILAVVVLYWKKFMTPLTQGKKGWTFYLKLLVAVLPALGLGFLLSDTIDSLLESSLTVAITMILGGIILLFIDNVFKDHPVTEEEQISFPTAFRIGLWQCVAMIPGVSRSAASIIGGMQQKLLILLVFLLFLFHLERHRQVFRLEYNLLHLTQMRIHSLHTDERLRSWSSNS